MYNCSKLPVTIATEANKNRNTEMGGIMSTREKWIDYTKVFACILVAVGHFFMSMIEAGILSETPLHEWFITIIYYFHVPLFCMQWISLSEEFQNNICFFLEAECIYEGSYFRCSVLRFFDDHMDSQSNF